MICGPTAVGKTEYAIDVALRFGGEIVSADSMQIYKYMDIGSAKPTPEEQSRVRHYLVDEIDPREPFSVALYQKRAKEAIEQVFANGRIPVISGGTGLYVSSLIYDMDFSAPPGDASFRTELEELASREGAGAVHALLAEKDPEAAARIHPNNLKKVIRALEAHENGGSGISPFEESFVRTRDYDVVLVGLTRDRAELYGRIDRRVDLLIEAGLVDEVKRLTAMGLGYSDISMKGIGYKEIIAYLNGGYDLDEAVRLVKQNTRRYSKRQMTWFRRYEDMKWFNISEYESEEAAKAAVSAWIGERIG